MRPRHTKLLHLRFQFVLKNTNGIVYLHRVRYMMFHKPKKLLCHYLLQPNLVVHRMPNLLGILLVHQQVGFGIDSLPCLTK